MNGNGLGTERVRPLGSYGQFIETGVQAEEINLKVHQEGPVCPAMELRLYQGSEDSPVLSFLPIPEKQKSTQERKLYTLYSALNNKQS